MGDQALSTLLNMGFGYEESSAALEHCKKDVSEAVAYLTDPTRAVVPFGPQLENKDSQPMEIEAFEIEEETFPASVLKDIKGRIYSENWSMNYREGEGLLKCINAAAKLSDKNSIQSNEDCKKFLYEVLPVAFTKLLTNTPLHDSDLQDAIYNITSTYLTLAVSQLKNSLELSVLKILSTVMDPRSEFNFRNRSKRSKHNSSHDVAYAQCPPRTTFRDPYGWLASLINTFGVEGGFQALLSHVCGDDRPSPFLLSHVLKPWGKCIEYLVPETLGPIFKQLMSESIEAMRQMTVEDYKSKEIGLVCDLLVSMKLICTGCGNQFTIQDAKGMDEMRLQEIKKMLKTSHFNARMNALNETLRIVEETRDLNQKYPIDSERVLEWLTKQRILMVALENNLHQTQYTAKLMKIADFIGASISAEDINQFWKLQEGRQPVVVENAHNIIAAAAVHFNEKQANHLFTLITQSWLKEDHKGRQRLLSLLGKLGKLPLVLEQVWALIHLKDVGIDEIEQGLTLHLELLNSPTYQDDCKKEYVMKCISDIKNREWVVPAMNYLVRILQNCLQSSSKLGKNILRELQNSVLAVKLITNSLVSNYTSITDKYNDRIHPDTRCNDSLYSLTECVHTHLKMLKLVLDHCSDFLHWNHVEAIWDCLAASNAALQHYDECCDWFSKAVSDLDPNTQTKLFEQRLQLLDTSSIRPPAFNCFKVYFEHINVRDGKIKRWASNSFNVESLKMTGLKFIWDVSLEAKDEVVSRDAMNYLLKVNYSALSPKLKKDCSALHLNFTNHCQELLQGCVEASHNEPSEEVLKRTANILNITTDYIVLAESAHKGVRLLEPHGARYLGSLITFSLELDKDNSIRVFHHANEKVAAVRLRAAKLSKCSPEAVELRVADETLVPNNDNKLLNLSQISEGCIVKVRVLPSASSPVKSWNEELNTPVKFEKQLPGVLLTTQPKVHRNLQVLSTMGKPVSQAVQRLLNQLPTDPCIQEVLESLETGKIKNAEQTLSELLTGPVTKITYNLEAISARIIPVEKDSSDRLALNTIFMNLTTEFPGAKSESRCPLDLFYEIFNVDSGDDPRSRRPSNMTLSELFLGEVKEEYLEVSLLVVSIFRGLLCGISSPLFKHNTPLNVTYLKKLSREQLSSMMRFFTHTALCGSFGSKLKSRGQPLTSQNSSTINRISDQHSALGCEAFELVMLGATYHPQGIGVLFDIMEQPGGYKRMLLDLLLYTPSGEVRSLVAAELEKLCIAQRETSTTDHDQDMMDVDNDNGPNVHYKLLQILLKTPLPIWGPSVHVRDTQKRLLSRCTQFFSLTSFLLREMSLDSEICRQLSINDLVKDEIKLLKTAAAEGNVQQAFVAGHLRLLCSLASMKGVDKRHVGKKLIPTLLGDFLFPAANIMYKSSGSKTRSKGLNDAPVTVNSEETQSAAYSLLVTLVNDSPENSRDVTLELVRLHHQPNQDLVTEWNYNPMVQPRAECGYVGLKNGGATCYMNAVLQQLHAVPGLSESVLCMQPPSPSSPSRSSQPKYGEEMFLQYQHLLGNLSESQQKFYTPEGFWKTFKLWGQPINLHEQQDAFELFNNLTDQVDDVLKARGENRIYQSQFGGEFVDQKICVECPHRSDLVEPFMSLSVSIRTGNLDDSLEQFVKGEVLEGDNAYLCEECDEKRTTLKRMCIKTLPNVLVIHLKRFDYDWERNKAFKFDDYFSFPNQLDMLPYTQVGVEGTAKQKRDVTSLYTLCGVVVHSGQANAGHYYSYIRKRGTGDWFKFNDDTVTPIKMTDQTMVEECFGGEFKSKGSSSTRNRYWNAYILFYDRVNEMCPPSPWKKPQKPISPSKRLKASRLSLTKLSNIPDHMEDNDPVNALEELIKTGEKSGMFHEKLPPVVRNAIIESNTKLLKERAVFNESYFNFVRKLVITNIASDNVKEFTHWSTKLMCNFYLHTFLHVGSSFQFHEEAWMETFRIVMESEFSAVATFFEFISSTRNHDYLTLHLLTCPRGYIRKKFAALVKTAMDCLQKTDRLLTPAVDTFISRYLALISRELTENNKYCEDYFGVLYHYSKLSGDAARHLRTRNFIVLFTNFLVGPTLNNGNGSNGGNGDHQPKWASSQLHNFISGYQTLGQIMSHTSLSQFHSTETNTPNPLASTNPEPDTPESSQGVHTIMSDTTMASNFLSHLLEVCHSVGHSSVSGTLCLMSWCNQTLTTNLLSQLVSRLAGVQAHELKPLFTLLLHLLALEDPYQLLRVENVITGEYGLLNLVRRSSSEDPKRAYQCVKFLTQLLRSNPTAKEHILEHITDWQWSVNWLKTAFETEAKSSSVSNESASTKGFQRTTSAQETLSDATALLNEFESSQ